MALATKLNLAALFIERTNDGFVERATPRFEAITANDNHAGWGHGLMARCVLPSSGTCAECKRYVSLAGLHYRNQPNGCQRTTGRNVRLDRRVARASGPIVSRSHTMRLVRLGFTLGAAVLSAQATLQPLGLAGVQTLSTAPATPPGVSQGQGRQGGNPPGAPRPRREVLLIERGRIVAALPAKAVATPRRPRKLLIFNGSANHPSVPYADLAMQSMGEKTGAFRRPSRVTRRSCRQIV